MRGKRSKVLRRMAFAQAVLMQHRVKNGEASKDYPLQLVKPCHIYPRGHVRRIHRDLKRFYNDWVRSGQAAKGVFGAA